jgi:hypothetical protein
MAAKSKHKGSAFERTVCKQLSLWVSGGESDDLFWRSAMSGGRATVGRKSGVHRDKHAGDITATSPAGHTLTDYWYVECKAYRDLALEGAMLAGTGRLAKFWREACEQATHYKKMPMLIAKQNNRVVLLITPLAAHMSPSGVPKFMHSTLLASSTVLRADFYDYEKVLGLVFKKPSDDNETFLHPGELARILGYQTEKPTKKIKRQRLVKRERLK